MILNRSMEGNGATQGYQKSQAAQCWPVVIRWYAGVATLLLLSLFTANATAQEQPPVRFETLEALIEAGGETLGAETCADCHEDYAENVNHRNECETCHGPGETHVELMMEDEDDTGPVVTFYGDSMPSVEIRNAVCVNCHKGGSLMHWQSSAHDSEDIACSDCHTVHRPGVVMERTTQAESCYRCHKKIRAQTYQASTHPIRESKVICSDCHNPHGAAGPAQLKQMSINDNCFICHAEKRGPFLWEHYPVSEDCSLCHRVHGSIHPALLTRQGPQLCQQCHANIGRQGNRHVRRFLDFDNPDDARRKRFVVGMNCANCHSQVHGSNHPSGANLLR